MALIVSLTQIDPPVVNRPMTLQVNVTNTSASSVTLVSLPVTEITEASATITQPNFLTPNVALGVGNPTIAGGATVSYTFKVTMNSPNVAGVSPAAFPSPAGVYVGQPPTDARTLSATATASDGSVASAALTVGPLSPNASFPPVATGTLQLQFQSGFNLIALAVGA